MITAEIRCTLQDGEGIRYDRYIGAVVRFRILNIDEIDTLGDRLSQAFTIELDEFNHPEHLSGMLIINISEVILNIADYAALAANGYIPLSREINLTHSIINLNNDKDNYWF